MNLPRRQVLGLMICIGVLLAGPERVYAQSFPSRPITMVAPFPPCGDLDPIGRPLAQRTREPWGPPGIGATVTGPLASGCPAPVPPRGAR